MITQTQTFYDELMDVISTFQERSRQIILRRLGFNNTCESLERIGRDLSVTRERVRQIEATCLQNIYKTCGLELTNKLKKCFTKRREPLYLELLEVEDDWFKGFSEQSVFLAQIIEKLTTYHVFKIKEREIITQITREDWFRLKAETLTNLKSQESTKLSQTKVKQLVRSIAINHNAAELGGLLHDAILFKLHYASPQGKGSKILCSVGRGLSNVLTALLIEANEPLHYTELARQCSAILGRHVEGYVHNSLKDLAYLYGRGIYGTLDHFPINEDDKTRILAAAEKIILKGPQGRQWTCSELLSMLKDKMENLPEQLNKYLINIILIESTVLKTVGRLVWITKKGKTGQVKESRIDLQGTVTLILEKAKKPLSTHEIKQLIKQQRGLDEYFTILPTTKIARIKPNIWGLVKRDFLLTKAQRHKIVDMFYNLLEQHQEGLHITELKNSIFNAGIKLPKKFTNYMAMSIAQAEPRLTVRRGQILGLTKWSDGKRVTVREAIQQIAKTMNSSMTMLELRQAVEEIVKHDVKQPLHRLLENAGIIREERTNTWNKLG